MVQSVKQFKLQVTKREKLCIAALKEMAGKLSTHSVIADHSSGEYTNLVDRGGLYHVEQIVYSLFVTIKIIVYKELTDIMLTNKGANIELKNNLGLVCDDEVVQLVWRMISPLAIEDNTA